MRKNLKIFLFSLLLVNFAFPVAQFASAVSSSDYEFNAYNLTFSLDIPQDKTNDIHYDYGVRLANFEKIGSIEENDTKIFKGLATFEITINLFSAYSAMDVYENPELKTSSVDWATIVTAKELGVSPRTLLAYCFGPVVGVINQLESTATNDLEYNTMKCDYTYWDLTDYSYFSRSQTSKLKDIGWAGPLGFNIDVQDLTPGTLEILDPQGNTITITQTAFHSNIVHISVGESETFEIGNYEDYWLNENDTMGNIEINDLTEGTEINDLKIDIDNSNLDLKSVEDLTATEMENEIYAITDDLGVYSDPVEPATTAYLGCQGVIRPPTQGSTLSNRFIDFAIRPHVQPYQQTIHHSNDPIFVFDTETEFLETSAGLIANSQIIFSERTRIVGWHVQNYVIQSKINVVSEIYSTCQIDAELGGSDNLGIPDFQLEDMFWNLVFEGDDEALITFKKTDAYTWLETYGPWIILGIVALVAIYIFGPVIPQMMTAGANRAIKKWGER